MSGPKAEPTIKPYKGPSGGWGSARSVGDILMREQIPLTVPETLTHQNHPDGFQCVSCAWGKPAKPSLAEICENGVKATAWEITKKRAGEDFFEKHTLTELEGFLDYDLEAAGRLTHPMR